MKGHDNFGVGIDSGAWVASSTAIEQEIKAMESRHEGRMTINDTTGHVEIGIRDFTALMLRLDQMIARLEAISGRLIAQTSSDDDIIDGNEMSLDEFIAFAGEYLADNKRTCAIFRFAGNWSHVTTAGSVVGAWASIDEALDATRCNNHCDDRRFEPA